MVALAERKLADGKPEEAMHVLDIVLNADPAHAAARKLMLRIHHQLLAAARTFCTTGNFWLVGWLEHRIRQLESGTP